MSENPNDPVSDDAPEVQHLEVEEYDDSDRVEAPEWYDDTIDIGDETNALVEEETS